MHRATALQQGSGGLARRSARCLVCAATAPTRGGPAIDLATQTLKLCSPQVWVCISKRQHATAQMRWPLAPISVQL